MWIVNRSHDCNKHYELRNSKKLFACDGCKMTGSGQRYLCKLCGHELHRECRFPKRIISHEYFGRSTFTFLEEPLTRHNRNNRREYSRCCDACGNDVRGFSYHCERDNLDLHPCCLNLEKKLLINDTIFHLRAKASSAKCICCKGKISDGRRDVPGWSYVSTCNNYNSHVYCMTEMAHEACCNNGEMGLEKVELQNLVKSIRNRGSTIFETIKSLLKIILAALLGDPAVLISNVFVELVPRGLK